MSNVIDASEHFLDRSSTVTKRIESLERELKSLPRLAPKDRARMAQNLGVLAVRLSPEAPLKGARMMFEKLGGEWQAKWRKRRRLLLLPDEILNEDDVVESGPPTFVRLAKAGGELLAAGSSDALVDRQRLDALRELIKGTSFGKDPSPESASLATGRELLTDALDRIARSIDQKTSILELWNVLESAPFERHIVSKSNKIDSIDFKDELSVAMGQFIESLFSDGDESSYEFGPSLRLTGNELPRWAQPSIKIGCLAIERLLPIFRFPETAKHILVCEEDYEDEVRLCQEGLMEMADFGAEGGRLPDEEYDPETGVGWQKNNFWQLYTIFLKFDRNTDGTLAIHFQFFHSCQDQPTLIPVTYGFIDNQVIEHALLNQGGWDFNELYPEEYANYIALFSPTQPNWWGNRIFQPGQFLGYIDRATDDGPDGEVGPVSDEWISDYVFGSEGMRFLPCFETDKSRPALLRPGSIGEALMRNLAHEDPALRLDTFLCAAADKIATEGLAYHRSLVEHYRDRLGTL